MNNKIFKIAIVGCGTISQNHITALSYLDNVTITALCDIKREKAEAKNLQLDSKAKIYTDYEEMLKCETLDAVHIATPHFLHKEMAISALERNINVFLEKPMCITYEEINEMLEAEKKSLGRISVCFQNRFNPSTLAAMKLIHEDGGAISAFGSLFWDRNAEYYTESGWRGAYATEGGGVMINQAIHTIDLLCQFMGKPESVIATKSNHHLKGIIEVEDTCEGMIRFESGKTANFFATNAFHGTSTTTVFILTKNHRIELRDNKLFVDGEAVSEATTETFVGKAVYGNGHKYLIAKFYEALENNLQMPVTLESAQYALKILLSAYKSADQEIII